MRQYFDGDALYGDDFTQAEIDEWFEAEREDYADLGAAEHGSLTQYDYHALNRLHGFRHLPAGRFPRALGLGSAYGAEFLPIRDRIDHLTVLEPSEQLRSADLDGVPLEYVSPHPSGRMPLDDAAFDLVVSLGTLHHIPNVSFVVSEMGRVTHPGGHVVIREPVTSMGDWRHPRPGLTAHERGIPEAVFDSAFAAAGLRVVHSAPCMFPTTAKLNKYGWGFKTARGVRLDAALARATVWNRRYHSTRRREKLRPTAQYYVLRKV